MRRLVFALVSGLLISAPASAAVKGIVAVTATRGPVSPVCRTGQRCDAPAQGVQVVVRRAGSVVARAVTNSGGIARVALRPGRYTVTAYYGAAMHARMQGKNVTVAAGRTSPLRFSFDTGIR